MIDNIVFVRELNSKLKYQTNQNDISFYKTYKTPNGEKDRQIRISSHGTYLKFWVEQDYDPSHGLNISIVFTKDGTPTNDCYIDDSTNEPYKDCRPCLSKQEQEGSACKPRRVQNYNQKKRPFSVTQFVYNCQNFEGDEIDALVLAIKNAAQTGNYIDPLSNIEGKRAIKVVLQPIDESKQINKTIINENKMKKVVRLTENDLHRIVKNSVNRILRENYEEEGLMNTVKGAWQGATQGANQMASNNSAMHTVSSALSQALTYFGQIHKLIAPLQQQNPQIAQAVQLCMQAYKECKGQMNSTYGTNNVTSQYGALPQQQ